LTRHQQHYLVGNSYSHLANGQPFLESATTHALPIPPQAKCFTIHIAHFRGFVW